MASTASSPASIPLRDLARPQSQSRSQYGSSRQAVGSSNHVNDTIVNSRDVHGENDTTATWSRDDTEADVNHEREQVNLPRADGGREAWLFLAGCFIIEALVWGFPFSFGVFQDHYSTLSEFSASASRIPIIGTSASGIMYLGAPFCFLALQSFPSFRRTSSILGLAIITLALIGSSFSTTVGHLILTQGVLYAIGGALLYSPAILYVDEWFIHRKGMAYGVMWAGTGTSGIVVPFIMSWGLNAYGFRTMLRAWALALLILSSPLLYYVKPRLPLSPSSTRRKTDFSFLRTPAFWWLQMGNVIEGLGFFIPGFYLPTYARIFASSSSSGTSELSRSLPVALFNLTSVFGQITFGMLIDRLHVTTVILISTLGTVASVFLLWGLSSSLPLLCVFALAYGVFAGGFTSTYTGVIKEVKKARPETDTGNVFGMLCAGRGIGAVVSGPVSDLLLGAGEGWKGAAAGYGSGFGGLIVFTGITALCGGLSFGARRAKLM